MSKYPHTVTLGLTEEDWRKLSELAAANPLEPRLGTLARVLLSRSIRAEWTRFTQGTEPLGGQVPAKAESANGGR